MSSVWPFIMSLVLSWYHCQAQPFVSAKIESSSTTKKNPIINSEIVEDLESGLKNVISQRMARFFMDSTSSSGYGAGDMSNLLDLGLDSNAILTGVLQPENIAIHVAQNAVNFISSTIAWLAIGAFASQTALSGRGIDADIIQAYEANAANIHTTSSASSGHKLQPILISSSSSLTTKAGNSVPVPFMGRKIPKISPDIISNSIPSYNSDLVKTLPEFKPLAGRLKLDLNSSGGGTQRRRQMLMMRSSHIGGGGGKITTNKDPNIYTAHHFGKNEKQNFVASIPYKQSFDSDLIVEGGEGGKGNKNNHNNNRRMLKALKDRENKDSMEKTLPAAVEKNVQQQNVIPKLKILRKVVKKVVSTPLPPTTMLLSKSSNSEVSNFVEA